MCALQTHPRDISSRSDASCHQGKWPESPCGLLLQRQQELAEQVGASGAAAHIALVEVTLCDVTMGINTPSLVRAQHSAGFCVWKMLTTVFPNFKIKVITSNWWDFICIEFKELVCD